MNCERFRALLDVYLDNELEEGFVSDVEAHVAACQRCRIALDERRGLNAAVKASTKHDFSLPADLRQHVLTRVSPTRTQRASQVWLSAGWFGWAIVTALAIAASSVLTFLLAIPSDQERLIDNAIAAHLRSLQGDHLTDVASSDPDVVQAWFKGQNQPASIVKDLASARFQLLGGRLDYLYKHPVAAVVYQHRGHPINLYMWPAQKDETTPIGHFVDEGFNVVLWTSAGMAFCAISNLNAEDLLRFTTVFASSAAEPV